MGSLVLVTLLAAASPGWATAVPTLVKVRPGASLPLRHDVSLHAARGECECFQVATTAAARAVHPTPLVLSKGDDTLTAELSREAFLELEIESGPDGAKGAWPDPLIPERDRFVHEARNAFPADASTKRPLVILAELCVPRTAAPGLYRGRLSLEAQGKKAERFEVSLRVDPFELPATSSLPNSFGLSLYSVAQGHHLAPESADARALLDRYAEDLLAHRITAYGLTFTPAPVKHGPNGLSVDFSQYDREMARYFEGKGTPDGARFTSAGVIANRKLTTDDEKVTYLKAWSDHFRQKRWPVVLFDYAKDEPTENDFPKVLDEGKHVRRAGGMSLLVTSAFEPKLADRTDIFCPLINCFFPNAGAATCRTPLTARALRARIPRWGHVWWYQSCMSHGCDGPMEEANFKKAFHGWASYMVDASGPTNRAMGPLAFLNGIGGELYFDTVYGYHLKDPWKSVWAFGGNGDGTLFYPGTPEKIGGHTPIPVDSLRLVQIRDGLEDYEYLKLAEQLGLGELARKSAAGLTPAGNRIAQDASLWERTRDELASALSKAWATKYRARANVGH